MDLVIKKVGTIDKQEIIDILQNDAKNDWLFSYADEIRRKYCGDGVHLRGLIEFSNICKRQCKYCGLRSENKNIERYRMDKEEILTLVNKAVELNYKTVVLQSGEDDYYTKARLVDIIKSIKKYDIALTLSIGERTYDELKEFKNAGADRFLLRIETTNKKLYESLHPNADIENRLKCLSYLKELGYEVGTGIIVGLPEQTIESIADDILFFKQIDADMIGIGPFISHPGTPLKDKQNGDFLLALKVMAITRILIPNANIPATTAMETLNPDGRIIALKSGANVVMPNLADSEYRKKYEIYPGKICLNDNADKCRICIENKIKSISRYVADDYGFRKT